MVGWEVEVREKQPMADGNGALEVGVVGGGGGVVEAGAIDFNCLDGT